MYKSPYCRHLCYIQNHEPKKWSHFDIVGTYSSGVKMTLKVGLAPMETTTTYSNSEQASPEIESYVIILRGK